MRVLIAHSRYLSGATSGENRVVEDEARLLSEGGHEVHVWQPVPRSGGASELLGMGMGSVWSFRAAAAVQRAIRRARVAVVHFHNLFPKLSPAVIRAAAAEGVPVVVTLHNYRLLCLPATLLRDGRVCEDCVGRVPWPGVLHRCYRESALGSGALAASLSLHDRLRTFDRVTLFLAVGDFVRDKHIQGGVPADRIRVKSNFAWPTPRRKGPGRYYLFLGRLSREKGVETILDAWRNAPGELLLVGDGPDGDRLRNLAPPRVRFIGAVPATDVAPLVREARAVVLPSVWYEAQPRVVLEAYAAGVPVLASRIGGLEDLITHGDTGLLVDPWNASSWTEAVKLVSDDSESERLGAGAFARWTNLYAPGRALRSLEEAYADAIERNAT